MDLTPERTDLRDDRLGDTQQHVTVCWSTHIGQRWRAHVLCRRYLPDEWHRDSDAPRVRVLNNTAERFGGGIANFMPGTLTIVDSVISGNIAANGNAALTGKRRWNLSSWIAPMPQAARTILIRSEVSDNIALRWRHSCSERFARRTNN